MIFSWLRGTAGSELLLTFLAFMREEEVKSESDWDARKDDPAVHRPGGGDAIEQKEIVAKGVWVDDYAGEEDATPCMGMRTQIRSRYELLVLVLM